MSHTFDNDFPSIEFDTYHKLSPGEKVICWSNSIESANLSLREGHRMVWLPLTNAWAVVTPPEEMAL